MELLILSVKVLLVIIGINNRIGKYANDKINKDIENIRNKSMLLLKELKESYQLSFVGKKESSANVIGFFMNNIHNEFEKIIESEMMKTNDVFYNLYRKACIKAFKNIVKICKDMELGFGQSNELPNRIEVKINKNIELMRLRI